MQTCCGISKQSGKPGGKHGGSFRVQGSRAGFWCRVFVFDVWVKGFVDVGGFTGRLVSCIGGYKYMRLQGCVGAIFGCWVLCNGQRDADIFIAFDAFDCRDFGFEVLTPLIPIFAV